MVGIVTGQGEGTVMCVPCSPEPHLHEKVTINVVSSDKVAWAGTQWGLTWSHTACRFELV